MIELSDKCPIIDKTIKITLGQKFEYFTDLECAIELYQKQNFVQFCISRSNTIENEIKKGSSKHYNLELRYLQITYSCIHSGKYHSRSKGLRPNQSSYRQDCEAKIRLKKSGDGEFLEVVLLNEEHNHELNQNIFAYLPRQRALDDASRKIAKKMLELGCNKKLVQNELMKTCNSKITMKDLHNLARARSRAEPLQKILQLLKQKEGSIVEMLKSEDNTLIGIFYQDREMQSMYKAYPEIFFLDSIYKVNDRMLLYVMLVEDGNGESEIVALFHVTVESSAVLTKIASLFKCHNPSWEKTEVILTDKDMIEHEAFKSEFPNAKLLICLFHALRTFRREITAEKRGITQGKRDLCLQIIQNMAYAKSEKNYMENYKQLKDHGPKTVFDYFNEHWHEIRNQWVIVLQQKQGKTCGNRTHNRLESTNQKIMKVVKRHSKLDNMFEDLLKLVTSLRIERDCSAAVTQLKKSLNVQITHPAENKYLSLLTSYAFAKIKGNFHLLDKVKVMEENDEGITVKATEGILKVTTDKCTCSFFVNMGLPCCHILRCRKMKDIDLYSSNLVAQRWTKSYLANSRLNLDVRTDLKTIKQNVHCSTMPSKTLPVLSQNQTFGAASLLTTKLASLASESTKHYHQRINVLKNLIKLWEEDNEATIVQGCLGNSEIINNRESTQVQDLPSSSSQEQDISNECNAMPSNQEPVLLVSQNIPKLTLKIPKRGRPQGKDETVIGLPFKRAKKKTKSHAIKSRTSSARLSKHSKITIEDSKE